MMTFVPRPCQTDIATIDGMASVGLLSHFWGAIPNTPRNWLSRPESGL